VEVSRRRRRASSPPAAGRGQAQVADHRQIGPVLLIGSGRGWDAAFADIELETLASISPTCYPGGERDTWAETPSRAASSGRGRMTTSRPRRVGPDHDPEGPHLTLKLQRGGFKSIRRLAGGMTRTPALPKPEVSNVRRYRESDAAVGEDGADLGNFGLTVGLQPATTAPGDTAPRLTTRRLRLRASHLGEQPPWFRLAAMRRRPDHDGPHVGHCGARRPLDVDVVIVGLPSAARPWARDEQDREAKKTTPPTQGR